MKINRNTLKIKSKLWRFNSNYISHDAPALSRVHGAFARLMPSPQMYKHCGPADSIFWRHGGKSSYFMQLLKCVASPPERNLRLYLA